MAELSQTHSIHGMWLCNGVGERAQWHRIPCLHSASLAGQVLLLCYTSLSVYIKAVGLCSLQPHSKYPLQLSGQMLCVYAAIDTYSRNQIQAAVRDNKLTDLKDHTHACQYVTLFTRKSISLWA